jgi:sec-independent protein translocase protein TatA
VIGERPRVHCQLPYELEKRKFMNETILAIGGLGTPELLVIAVVIFLLFGATRLPQLAKSLGQSKRAFKEGLDEGEKESQKEVKEKQV